MVHSLALSSLSSYAVGRKSEPFYKRRKVGTCPGWGGGQQGDAAAWGCRVFSWLRLLCPQLDQTGQHLFCVCGTRVNILDV